MTRNATGAVGAGPDRPPSIPAQPPGGPGSDRDLWAFAPELGAGDHSVLDYAVLATDRGIGRVAGIVHEPGRARLEVRARRWPRVGLRTIPAGVVATIDHGARLVLVNLTRAQVLEAPGGTLAATESSSAPRTTTLDRLAAHFAGRPPR